MVEGAPDTEPRQLTADHHPIPVIMGGKTVNGNIVAACRECNNSRHPENNRSPDTGERYVASTGETNSGSPFDVLKQRKV